jgi:RNA polymerase sigma factor (sigma-70 family)
MATPDPAAFAALLEEHKALLYKVAYAYCRDREDRRDLVQEMAIQLWRSLPRFDGRVKLNTWTWRIAMNVAITHFRSEGRRIRDTVPLEDFALDIAAADRAFEEDGDNMRVLGQLIRGMDELNRALVLLYLEGRDQDEIAAIVGITPTNVATRIHRIKQKLTREFNALEESP